MNRTLFIVVILLILNLNYLFSCEKKDQIGKEDQETIALISQKFYEMIASYYAIQVTKFFKLFNDLVKMISETKSNLAITFFKNKLIDKEIDVKVRMRFAWMIGIMYRYGYAVKQNEILAKKYFHLEKVLENWDNS
jgi:hypothetical protein